MPIVILAISLRDQHGQARQGDGGADGDHGKQFIPAHDSPF
jgi:hypothetical protein